MNPAKDNVKRQEIDDENSVDDGEASTEDKALTFRKRRLSLNNLRQSGEEKDKDTSSHELDKQNDEEVDDDPFAFFTEAPPPGRSEDSPKEEVVIASTEEEKAQSFRKRRLSLTLKKEDKEENDIQEPVHQRRRRDSDLSMGSDQDRLKSRTVHASELLSQPPPSPSAHQLYQQRNAPPQRATIDALIPASQMPKWKTRQTRHLHEDDRALPFPREVVGTFSCHGVEPVYEFDDEDEDAAWGDLPNNNHDHDKPTTAAKINQDRGGVSFPYGNCARTALFAVYDGHGQGGELVSQFALHEVQRRLEKHPLFDKDIEQAFKQTFTDVDESLKEEAIIEPLYAGTTACVALLREQKLVLANSGDSRAVCARRDGTAQGGYKVLDLTIDQNPDLPAEQARIEGLGGYVSPPPEPGLSARVWLDPECTQIGLAMARSIGDHAVKEIGVIAEPVVSFHEVTAEDEFVIFATDGVWEFISSEEAVKVVASNLDRGATRACQALIETAAAKWHEEEGDYRDDITALVVRLPQLWEKDVVQVKLKM